MGDFILAWTMKKAVLILIVFFVSVSIAQSSDPWSVVDQALQKGISTYGYPGCVAIVGDADGVLYRKSFGNYTYGKPVPLNDNTNPKVTLNTLFDMASCTKVTGATSAAAQFYQRGQLDLNTTASYFTTEYNHTQSCRALGWSTNDPTVTDEGWNLSCGNLSSKTWTHIGYTGT